MSGFEDISDEVDHYVILGLPSGEKGAKLTQNDISKAYKIKALEHHPDKRPDDPNAKSYFYKITSSYEVLKDEKSRKLFDERLCVRREHAALHSLQDSERHRIISDLERRQKSAKATDPEVAHLQEEKESIARLLKEEKESIDRMLKEKKESIARKLNEEKESIARKIKEEIERIRSLQI